MGRHKERAYNVSVAEIRYDAHDLRNCSLFRIRIIVFTILAN